MFCGWVIPVEIRPIRRLLKKNAEFLYQLQHVRQKWKPPATDTLCLQHILTIVPQSSIIVDYVGQRVTSEMLIGTVQKSGSTVAKVLCYKSEGRWVDSRCCHWNFSLT